MKKGFTLIELLILILILIILTIVMILIINPGNMLSRARDSRRLAELSSINKAIQIAGAQGNISLGSSTVVYVSIPDTISSECSSLGLPILPGGWTYHCATPDNYRKTDGTGWIPVDFNSLKTGAPFGALPVDPVNTTSTGLYYTYTYDNGSWAATTLFESATYQEKYAATQNASSTTVYSSGNDFSLTHAILFARGGGGGGGLSFSTPYVWVPNIGPGGIGTASSTLTKLDNSNGNTLAVYPESGNGAWSAAVDDSGNIWVANTNGGNVSKINGSNGSVIGVYPVGTFPHGIAVDISGNIWVANSNFDNRVTKLNGTNGSVIGNYPILDGGSNPFGVAADAFGNIWVTAMSRAKVAKLDSSNGNVIGTYSVGSGPVGVAVDASGNVWVANGWGNTVTKLDNSGNLIGTYSFTGSGAYGIAIDASGNVWIANSNGSTVTKMDNSGNLVGTYSTAGLQPNGIAIDASGNVWVVNYSKDAMTDNKSNVSKINGSDGNIMGNFSLTNPSVGLGDMTGFAYQYFVLGRR
jgi:DNA-binding beta-propeller fold protein YncE